MIPTELIPSPIFIKSKEFVKSKMGKNNAIVLVKPPMIINESEITMLLDFLSIRSLKRKNIPPASIMIPDMFVRYTEKIQATSNPLTPEINPP